MPALLTRMSRAAHRGLGRRHQGLDGILVRQVAGHEVDALAAEFGGQGFQRLGAGAGNGDDGTLRVERLGDGAAEAAGRAGDESLAAGQVEHGQSCCQLSVGKAATSSGVPTGAAVEPEAIRLTRPVSTLPLPIS